MSINFSMIKSSDRGDDPRNDCRGYLSEDKRFSAFDQSERGPVGHIRDRTGSENAGQNRAESPAHPVNAKSVERVVVTEFIFYGCTHPVTKQACRESHYDAGDRLDKSGCRG